MSFALSSQHADISLPAHHTQMPAPAHHSGMSAPERHSGRTPINMSRLKALSSAQEEVHLLPTVLHKKC